MAAQNPVAAPFPRDNAVFLPAQYDADYNPSKTSFIVPRSEDIVVVGYIIQRNNWSLKLTEHSPEVKAMWARAKQFVGAHLMVIRTS